MSSKVLLEPAVRIALFEQMADYLRDYSLLRDGDGYHGTIFIAEELLIFPPYKLPNEVKATLSTAVLLLRGYSNWLRPSKKEWRNLGIYEVVVDNWIKFNKAFQQFQVEVEAIQNPDKVTARG